MSDHAGGFLINRVLHMFHREHVFELLGKERTHRLLRDILHFSCRKNDCNSAEVLGDLEEIFGICYVCWNASDQIADGRCPQCRPRR